MRTQITLGVILSFLPGMLQAQTLQGKLDEWGNPVGQGLGLARDGEFQGKRLLVWTANEETIRRIYPEKNPLWKALKAKGFEVDLREGPFDRTWLYRADQLWVFSSDSAGMTDADYDEVVRYVKRGKGVYLLADNDPFLIEADALAQRLFEARVVGNYTGRAIIVTRGREMTGDDLLRYGQRVAGRGSRTRAKGRWARPVPPGPSRRAEGVAAMNRAAYHGEPHALLTDVHYLYEGISISHLVPSDELDVVVSASDGQALIAVARDPKQRVVIDCGYTRYLGSTILNRGRSWITKQAIPPGQIRFAENVAAYLVGKRSKR
jgi:hypothetical protein